MISSNINKPEKNKWSQLEINSYIINNNSFDTNEIKINLLIFERIAKIYHLHCSATVNKPLFLKFIQIIHKKMKNKCCFFSVSRWLIYFLVRGGILSFVHRFP